VWGEFASWGVDYTNLDSLPQFVSEWKEVVERDFNHPSIITWCPTNEVWFGNYKADNGSYKYDRDYRYIDAVYNFTKALDETRPCVAVSGGQFGRFTDVYDFHCYKKSDELKAFIEDALNRDEWKFDSFFSNGVVEEGSLYKNVDKPFNLSEYGGVAFNKDGNSWGYHVASDEDVLIDEYVKATETVLKNPKISGFCYTQLYDVEQEQNGLYTYERELKVSPEGLKKIYDVNVSVAEIEKE
jgi:hypothetical protein